MAAALAATKQANALRRGSALSLVQQVGCRPGCWRPQPPDDQLAAQGVPSRPPRRSQVHALGRHMHRAEVAVVREARLLGRQQRAAAKRGEGAQR